MRVCAVTFCTSVGFLFAGCGAQSAPVPQEDLGVEHVAEAVTLSDPVLTCQYAWDAIPPVTHWIDMAGSEVRFKFGINKDFGGIGVELRLVNLQYPAQEVGILEGRSAAGSGWQFSQFVRTYDDQVILTNQAAGNAVGYQWGFSNAVSRGCSASSCYINATTWTPLYRDTFAGAGQTPCPSPPGTSWSFDEGKFDMAAQAVAVPGQGNAITFSHLYTARSNTDQYWLSGGLWEAHYFRRQTGHDGGLRMFVRGDTGWQMGPISLAEGWTGQNLVDQGGTPRAHMLALAPGWTGSWSDIDYGINHIVLVWNIFGLDIGIVLRNLPDRASFRMVKNIYCQDTSNYECGSIDLIAYQTTQDHPHWPVGSTRSSQFDYYVGTTAQLQALGYWVY